MIDSKQFHQFVIVPALASIALDGASAETLLMMTCAQESDGGTYLHQEAAGPALGIYQMEPVTYEDNIHYIMQGQTLRENIIKACNFSVFPVSASEMITNLKYATMIARVHYLRAKDPLPAANDIEGLWQYYKKYWNTEKGAATRDEFMQNWKLFTGE